jgi:phage shock protein PspC (stress-responsive transcriptional regulator)
VTLSHTQDAIAIMGTPEDFGAEPIEEEAPKSSKSSKDKFEFKPGKKLYRNSEDEVIAGVCSGVASYLGVQDPLWVRLAFLLIVLSGGIGIPVYLILWAILPVAETASDRLAMRGDPINVSNIGKIIEEEMDHFSVKMTALGDELKEEFGSKKKVFSERAPKVQKRKVEKVGEKVLEAPLRRGFIF